MSSGSKRATSAAWRGIGLPWVCALVMVFGSIAAAPAQQSDLVVPPEAVTGAAMAPVDEAFALYAASSGLAQIEGARLVLKSTRNAELRDYAHRIVRDHNDARERLQRIVVRHGLRLPPTPTGRHADLVTKLSGVAEPSLDDAYLTRFGIDAHKETIALVERHLAEGKSPVLKAYAQQILPLLREHLALAHKLAHAAGGTR